jgi:hypothetical protein
VGGLASEGVPLWMAAEESAAAFMRVAGFRDAACTVGGADGGLDIVATDAAAQVKAQSAPVGRPDVQRLCGAAHCYPNRLFFSGSGYTNAAKVYADQASVALFTLDADLAPIAVNGLAEIYIARRAADPSGGAAKVGASAYPAEVSFWVGLAVLVLMPAVVIAGPLLFMVSREAMSRAGEALVLPISGRAPRRRLAVAAAGALGTLFLASLATQHLIWTLSDVRPADAEPGAGAALGVLLGALILAGLEASVRSGHLRRLPLPPAFVRTEQPQKADLPGD